MIQHQAQDISLTSTSGWIVGLDGSVYVHTQLSPATVKTWSINDVNFVLNVIVNKLLHF
jgi:hypothetical protein